MTNSIETPNRVADSTADLLFAVFVFVADVEEGLTARDVQSLHQLFDNTAWCTGFLKDALDSLRARYGDIWKEYQKKTIARDLRTVAEKFDLVANIPGSPARAEIANAVRFFLTRFWYNASPILVRLGISAIAPAKQSARQELDALLEKYGSGGGVTAANEEPVLSPGVEPVPSQLSEPVLADISIWPSAGLGFSPDNIWKRGRTAVRCVDIISETHDVKTFYFQAVKPTLFGYKPGQFATIELPINGKTIRRSYTISSSPSRPHILSITVKRVPDGLVSNWLHDNMEIGFHLDLSGPHGEFSCFDAPSRKLLLIAAGSGITPVMSMLRWVADTLSPADVVFINNFRTPADVIFERELAYIESRLGENLKLGLIPSVVKEGQAWNGSVGHFSEDCLRRWAPDFAEREVFVCGPSGYMDFVRTTLEKMGFPMQHYHQESFGGASVPGSAPPSATRRPAAAKPAPEAQPAVAKPVTEQEKVEVVLFKSGKTLHIAKDEFILDAAEEHDISLESSCRSGSCGTCKIKKIEGEVDMEGQQGLSEAELSEGFVLACVSRACTRLVLDI